MCDKYSSTKIDGTEKELCQIGKWRLITQETDGWGNTTNSNKKGKRKVFRLLFQSLQHREGLIQSFNRHLTKVKDKLADKRGEGYMGSL